MGRWPHDAPSVVRGSDPGTTPALPCDARRVVGETCYAYGILPLYRHPRCIERGGRRIEPRHEIGEFALEQRGIPIADRFVD